MVLVNQVLQVHQILQNHHLHHFLHFLHLHHLIHHLHHLIHHLHHLIHHLHHLIHHLHHLIHHLHHLITIITSSSVSPESSDVVTATGGAPVTPVTFTVCHSDTGVTRAVVSPVQTHQGRNKDWTLHPQYRISWLVNSFPPCLINW